MVISVQFFLTDALKEESMGMATPKPYERSSTSLREAQAGRSTTCNARDEALAALAECGMTRSYARHDTIVWPGEAQGWTLLVVRGRARSYRLSPMGKSITLREFAAGDIIPAVSSNSYIDAEADGTVVCRIRRIQFDSLLLAQPELAARLAGALFQHLDDAYDRMEELAFHDVRTRLARTLCRLAQREGQRYVVRATHEELASLVVTSRQQVTEWLTDLRTQGAVRSQPHRSYEIEIVDMARLQIEGFISV